jgi:hypothetical protein
MSSRSVQEPPLPWRPFLEELDEALSEGVELHCIGGVQYVRAQAGFEVTTEASDFECGNMTHWGRIHRKYEMWLKDPDDVFLDAEERNEQRKKQGLPPRIIILPWSAEEEKKLGAAKKAQAKKRLASGKRGSSSKTSAERKRQ